MFKDNNNRKRLRFCNGHHLKRNKRLRQNLEVTPWIDEWELQNGGMALTSPLPFNIPVTTQALESVAVWKCRASLERIPHAVEATSSLAQAMLSDSQESSLSSPTSPLLLVRLAYSSAVVRCINGFADGLRQRRATAGSVSVLCAQLGIPSWIVDVRHEAAHNALPSLDALRLASSTLMAFLRNEYWIPTCRNWPDDKSSNTDEDKAVEFLIQYKASAAASRVDATNTLPRAGNKPKKAKNNPSDRTTPPPRRRGRVGPFLDRNSSGDSDSDSDEFDDWDLLLGNSLWTTSIGTNINRFAALQQPKKDSSKKNKESTAKKQNSQMKHMHYAKEFVRNVSIQLGYSTALKYLVWGGIGGVPVGRGVLIPGSPSAFPATENGICKARDRYSPLILTISRAWPGFAPALLVHIVDFVLALECKAIDGLNDESQVDLGKARKLYFLCCWVRFLLSWQFIRLLDPSGSSSQYEKAPNRKSNRAKNMKGVDKSADASLASLAAIERFQYPLNSICDRCSQALSNGDKNTLGTTTNEILELLESILGDERVRNFGVDDSTFDLPNESPCEDSSLLHDGQSDIRDSSGSPGIADYSQETPTKLSLAAMEALLADEEESLGNEEENLQSLKGKEETTEKVLFVRPAWVRCKSWETCSIGTLPGYPF